MTEGCRRPARIGRASAGHAPGVTGRSRDERPLILTLRLEDRAQQRFEAERAALFPRGRTAVGAHVTMFHALPAHLRHDVHSELEPMAEIPPFPVAITGVVPLGRGVAYRLEAEQAQLLHRRLQDRWRPHLTRQDAQPFRPHVTVQNKVDPELAKATLDRLRATFRPETTRAVGLELWRYDGGPWTHLHRWSFQTARGR